jgi:hypothetical protein
LKIYLLDAQSIDDATSGVQRRQRPPPQNAVFTVLVADCSPYDAVYLLMRSVGSGRFNAQ